MKKLVAVALLALAPLAAGAADTLAKVKSAKAITVAYSPDSLPFSFAEAGGEPRGYTIDLCKRVIAQVGRAAGVPNLKVNWVPGTTPQRLEMVAKGKADLECANTTQTLSRLGSVDFSNLIFLESGGFVGRKDAPARIADMGGKKIVVLKGTTSETRLRTALERRLVNAVVVPVEKTTDAIGMLEAGTADLFAGDRIKLIGAISQAKDPTQYAMSPEDYSYEPYALALPRGDSAFRLEVNRALTQVYVGGDIEVIFGQWLGQIGRPSNMLVAMFLLSSIPE
jgi:ABC-type amino acid transport substrate-binding protein